MRRLKNSTIGKLLKVYKTMDYYEACECPSEDDHIIYDIYPDFYGNNNIENIKKLQEFAKTLNWEY